MGVFSGGGIGLDLGSTNITVYLENEGVVLREPSFVLTLREDVDEILAFGRDARQMLGRTPKDVSLLSPIVGGAVGNIDLTIALIRNLTEKALGKRRAIERSPLVVSLSQGATRVEQEALETAVRSAGAKSAFLLRTPIAAALGAGVTIDDARGCMIVVLGGMTTEIGVLSLNGIAAARVTRRGSNAIDESIVRYIRRENGLIIGQRTAEDLKIDLGSASNTAYLYSEEASLRGRDARSGRPATVTIHASDVHRAIVSTLDELLENIREAFENTPAEMAEDIMTRGIYLSGGGAQLDGLRDRLSDMLNLPVRVMENPQDHVSRGCCMVASDNRLAQKLLQTGCLIEL